MDERKQDTARIPDAQTPAPETGDTQWQPLEMPEEMRETCLYSLFDVAAAETWLGGPGPGGLAVPGDPELEGGV